MLRSRNKSVIISYLTLRRLIGWLGILLPFICIIGGRIFAGLRMQSSVSAYYHTNMQDLFTGLLICMAVFLLTYKGREVIDNIISTVCGIAALGIVSFPCEASLLPEETRVGLFNLPMETSDDIHLICAASFFIILALNSIFIFTLTDKKKKDMELPKKIRNWIYRISGIIILASLIILGIVIAKIAPVEITNKKIVMKFEMVMLASFGLSWLIKGETLLTDNMRLYRKR